MGQRLPPAVGNDLLDDDGAMTEERIARIAKALSHPARIRILEQFDGRRPHIAKDIVPPHLVLRATFGAGPIRRGGRRPRWRTRRGGPRLGGGGERGRQIPRRPWCPPGLDGGRSCSGESGRGCSPVRPLSMIDDPTGGGGRNPERQGPWSLSRIDDARYFVKVFTFTRYHPESKESSNGNAV